jgi:hypothetical protein
MGAYVTPNLDKNHRSKFSPCQKIRTGICKAGENGGVK